MTLLTTRDPYSYRADPAVPSFDDAGAVTFMDGECALCTVGARLIATLDKADRFKICPVQTPLGRAMLAHYGLEVGDPESWLLLVDGKAYTSLDAIIRVGRLIGGIGWLLQPLRLLPRSVQDWLYRRIARNRYTLFGRTDMCAVPDPRLRAKLMD
ncbi:MAG: thiol-disulfide oxidoreductase DCC family protein [Cohaesibacteraceae bacterium]